MAGPRFQDPSRLDVAALALAGGSLAGEWPLAALARLRSAGMAPADAAEAGAADADPAGPPVVWHAEGERARLADAGVQPALHLAAETTLRLQCQRCLKPMDVLLHVDRRLFFVEGEDAAAALDAESEDDVLALQPVLDLRVLIEDELLLALPIVPRHDVCPQPLARPLRDEEDAAETINPFASLASLELGGKLA